MKPVLKHNAKHHKGTGTKNKNSRKILFLVIAVIVLVILGVLLKKFYFTTCPSSCDDNDKCTNDYCSKTTHFACVHDAIVCNDNNKCTEDTCSRQSGCAYEKITPCIGNNVCEPDEYGTNDCPICDDGNGCTKDSINYLTQTCTHEIIRPCCGNGLAENEETCVSCPSDVKCTSGMLCCSAGCKEVCKQDSDCVSNDPSKIGKCTVPNTCSAYCTFEVASTIELKTTTYTAHGLKFDVLLEDYGDKISYYDTSGQLQYLGAQDGKKLLNYQVTVQCVEENCNSFYSSSFMLMDAEGNTYGALCPIDVFHNCKNRDQLTSMYDALKSQKTTGMLIFSIPISTNNVFLIYKFSSYDENPKNLKFITILS